MGSDGVWICELVLILMGWFLLKWVVVSCLVLIICCCCVKYGRKVGEGYVEFGVIFVIFCDYFKIKSYNKRKI